MPWSSASSRVRIPSTASTVTPPRPDSPETGSDDSEDLRCWGRRSSGSPRRGHGRRWWPYFHVYVPNASFAAHPANRPVRKGTVGTIAALRQTTLGDGAQVWIGDDGCAGRLRGWVLTAGVACLTAANRCGTAARLRSAQRALWGRAPATTSYPSRPGRASGRTGRWPPYCRSTRHS